MGKKQFARDPLLYIHQPSIGTPEAPMQSDYRSPRTMQTNAPLKANTAPTTVAESNTNKQDPIKKVPKQPIRKTAFEKQFNKTKQEDNTAEATQDDESILTDAAMLTEDATNITEPVKFKDRSLKDKISYFADAPEFAPKMRCEVKTEARTYRGYIVDRQEDIVYMRTGKRTSNTKIPVEKIIDIRMLGF
ncbi:hypothetical protein JOC34_004040 [Virgibacillus halotolerans]|uniref:CotO family spore coat protein n=1 Tax=Virgibacillus halotolerans TaxID=1071053 RepID=UPI001960F6EB|nr:CotO family spore coat protein [Virgibacillus halotolerans]MBM7601612.1 hypothetical protein [Virgibacillus halotolerans]